jgi:hypothetical protein
LSPATTPSSTLGETSSSSQVLLKGPIVRVFLVHCCSIEPWVCPYANPKEIISMKDDKIPKGLTPLESSFSLSDVGNKEKQKEEEVGKEGG